MTVTTIHRLVALACLALATVAATPAAAEERLASTVSFPEWLARPPQDGKHLYAIGASTLACTDAEAEAEALAMARALLSLAIDSRVEARTTFSAERLANDGDSSERIQVQDLVTVASDAALPAGSVTALDTWRGPGLTLVLARVPRSARLDRAAGPVRLTVALDAPAGDPGRNETERSTLAAGRDGAPWLLLRRETAAPGGSPHLSGEVALPDRPGLDGVRRLRFARGDELERVDSTATTWIRGAGWSTCPARPEPEKLRAMISSAPVSALGPVAGEAEIPAEAAAPEVASAIASAWARAAATAAFSRKANVEHAVDSVLEALSNDGVAGSYVERNRVVAKLAADERLRMIALDGIVVASAGSRVRVAVLASPAGSPPFDVPARDESRCDGAGRCEPAWLSFSAGPCPVPGMKGRTCAVGISGPRTRSAAVAVTRALALAFAAAFRTAESSEHTSLVTDVEQAPSQRLNALAKLHSSAQLVGAVPLVEHEPSEGGLRRLFVLAPEAPTRRASAQRSRP